MVGGIIVEVSEVKKSPKILYVNCMNGAEKPETYSLYVEKNKHSMKMQIGDGLSWNKKVAMWTPQRNRLCVGEEYTDNMYAGVDYDIKIPRRKSNV